MERNASTMTRRGCSYIWRSVQPYVREEVGRQIYEGEGLLGKTVRRLPLSTERRKSVAKSIFHYNK